MTSRMDLVRNAGYKFWGYLSQEKVHMGVGLCYGMSFVTNDKAADWENEALQCSLVAGLNGMIYSTTASLLGSILGPAAPIVPLAMTYSMARRMWSRYQDQQRKPRGDPDCAEGDQDSLDGDNEEKSA
jgi:hypothetical protein